MNTGDLVLFRGRGPIAWLIRTWTRSAWDHCGVLWVCAGVPMVIEARFWGGVAAHALANRQKDGPTIYPTGRVINIPLALSHCGDNYSAKDAIRAGEGEAGDHAGWQCAEFAAMLLGLPGNNGWTPQSLADALYQKAA